MDRMVTTTRVSSPAIPEITGGVPFDWVLVVEFQFPDAASYLRLRSFSGAPPDDQGRNWLD